MLIRACYKLTENYSPASLSVGIPLRGSALDDDSMWIPPMQLLYLYTYLL